MGRLIMTGMPDPDIIWCAACAALAKGAVFADDGVQRRAQEGLADAGRELVVIAPPDTAAVRRQLQEAVTWGPSPVVGGGIPVPLCWTHLAAVDGTQPPPEQQQQGPSLYPGRRG